jgi:glutamate-1-semialdehyde 2,1-aminomutase
MYPDTSSNSAKLYERALRVLPGGNTRNTVFFPPYPVYAASGQGCYVTDVDGNRYIDFINNASASIHGHSHPEILAAMRAQMEKLVSVCLPTEPEVRLAEVLVDRLPGVEQVRFCNSGSEAVMFALKAARAHTGRPKIAKVEGAYHGAYDAAETSMDSTPSNWGGAEQPQAVPHSVGTPAGTLADVVVLPFNDVEGSLALLEANKDSLAAVLVDPLVSRMSFTPASSEYLGMLRSFATRTGAALVFDEVFSFRMGYHGAQGEVGVTPDLTALGKVIGGGLPVGAIGGKAEFMAVFDHRSGHPKAPHGGTFNANPLTMAAGLRALELLTPDVYAELRRLGDRARKGLNEAFAIAGVDGQARGYSSMISTILSGAKFTNYREFLPAARSNRDFGMIHRHLLNSGVLVLASGAILLSTPMTNTEIDRLIECYLDALRSFKTRKVA